MRILAWLAIGFSITCLALFVRAEEGEKLSNASAVDSSRIVREEEKRLLAALTKKITFECEEMPLDEALFKISELIDCPILVDTSKLEENGVSTDEPVTLKIGEMTAWQTLHFVLRQLRLSWVANDGVLEVTNNTAAAEAVLTRVYDVHKLCKLLEPLTRDMSFRRFEAKAQRPQNGVGGAFFNIPTTALATSVIGQFGGVPVKPHDHRPAQMAHKSVEAILARMIVICTPFNWIEREGNGGSIQLGEGCLIISQSYQGQFEIAGMLESLEQLVDSKVHFRSIAARSLGYPANDDAKIFEILAKPTNVDIASDTLENVLKQIADDARIRIWIDRPELHDEGVSTEELIGPRRKMQKLPLAICLKKILEPIKLTAVVDQGALVITSQSHAAELMTVRFYDINGISKIANEDPASDVATVLSRSTHGRWQEEDGEGGSAAMISPRHLAVRQTQSVHAEIALLIDDLAKEELVVPVEPAFEIRVYTSPDIETARDLERVLPQLIASPWSARGSIRQAGASVIVKQPVAVHDRIEEIMDKLEQSHVRQNPAPKEPIEKKTVDEAIPQK